MLVQIFFFFLVIFVAEAVYFKELFTKNPNLNKCVLSFKMFDASGKLPNGLMSQHFADLGNFDQCLGIEENNKSEIIKGKYCVMKISLPLNEQNSESLLKLLGNHFGVLPKPKEEISKNEGKIIAQGIDNSSTGLVLGWCLPHKCPIDELSAVLSSITQEIHPDIKVSPVLGGLCQTKDDLKIVYDTNSIVLITFLAATLLVIIISTLYDVYIQHHKKKPAHIILIAFSIKTNGQKLFSVSYNPDQLTCLNGIRFLSMMWIILGHRFTTSIIEPVINLSDMKDWVNNTANMYILNASVSVDSFFVLSGLLVSYVYCLARDKGIKINIISFYIHRYLRLTPVLAVLVWIHATIIGYLGSGPFWPLTTEILQKFCIENWWSPLVYVQNYYNMDAMCLGQTWYLSVDMQLFILSPIILIPLWRWPKQTMYVSAILVLGSMGCSFGITYVRNLPAFNSVVTNNQDYMDNYYIATHTRYGPWLMGLMLGYYIFKLKKSRNYRISLHPTVIIVCWITAMGLLLAVLFSGHNLLLHGTRLGSSFFNGFHRHTWALGLCWVIFACTQGYGGPVNTFLSWPLFQILSRFTYTMYLVHLSMQFLMAGTTRTSSYFSDFHTMYLFWGDFMVALTISVCLTFAFESPMVTIEKVLFKTGYKPRNPELSVYNKDAVSESGHTNKGFERNN